MLFFLLLLVTLVTATAVAAVIDRIFRDSIASILQRIVRDEIATGWVRYIRFAIYVVGISRGVRIWELERYVTPQLPRDAVLSLTTERWVFEIYRTVIGTLQGIAWMLLVFFGFALVAYVLVRVFEARRGGAAP